MVKKKTQKKIQRILIIRLSSIGDILLTTPLIRMIKRQMGNVEIDFLIKKPFISLVQENPYINHIIPFDPNGQNQGFRQVIGLIVRSGYDIVLDLQNNQRSFLFRFFSGARIQRCFYPGRLNRFLLVHLKINKYRNIIEVPLRYLKTVNSWGISDDGEGLELYLDEKSNENITQLLKSAAVNKEKIVVIAPGAAHATKRWDIKRFAEVGEYFAKDGMHIVAVGGSADQMLCQELVRLMNFPIQNYSGQLTLLETAALIRYSKLMVTNDTGIMHIGAAFHRKMVVLFGPTTHHFGFRPFRTPAVVIERPLSCRPCSYHGSENCPKGHFRCMKEITSEEVIKAGNRLIKEESYS